MLPSEEVCCSSECNFGGQEPAVLLKFSANTLAVAYHLLNGDAKFLDMDLPGIFWKVKDDAIYLWQLFLEAFKFVSQGIFMSMYIKISVEEDFIIDILISVQLYSIIHFL